MMSMMKKIPYLPLCMAAATVFLCGVAAGQLDPERYITLDEIDTDMEAYTLTVWSGTEIERFDLKILSIVLNRQPGEDMILVLGLDERLKASGAVQGVSGSPVYIDGRLAGALAAGWMGSLEPLYLVRPIENMLQVGAASQAAAAPSGPGHMTLDVSGPLDLSAIYDQAMAKQSRLGSMDSLPLALATSLPAEVCRQLSGSDIVAGATLLPGALTTSAAGQAVDVPIEPGSVLSAVLCTGDINLAALGTATDVQGDTIYGFGHSFTGLGAVEFPMAAGTVHTVVAGRTRSFKFSSPGPILGTIEYDQNAAVRGRIGAIPTMVPLRISVERFNDPEVRVYDCKLAFDRQFTPLIARLVVQASALMQGPLPPEHTVRYKGRIEAAGREAIVFDNISSGRSVAEMGMEILSTLTLLLNNPFELVRPEAIDVELFIEPGDSTAGIWSAQLSRTTVKPGQTVTANLMLQTFRASRTAASIELTIPDSMPAGKHTLHLMGAAAYNSFLTQHAPHRFRVVDTDSLLTGLDQVLNMPRNKLYAVLPVPATGLTMRRHALPDLPPTRMALMQDPKRLEPAEPYRNWIQNSVVLDTIISGAVQVELTVEHP